MVTAPVVSVTVLGEPGEVDEQARQLRGELRALDVARVEFAPGGELPPGAKAVDPATVSTIIVALASSRVLVQLGKVLQDWVNRGRDRKIVVRDGDRSLEITGTTRADTQRAIDEFFDRPDQ
ncbi:effector-associated constant component EACC1 [Goodfellowiella coeruleoviolacea]|uniref:Uncharacterized protein n=1 Tax=Goodfellowiella coeruleoviolacea TaxID=334858 RepID=A0AAE3GCV9_9PSEU|nr:hypothetical protein [Goodfellowiella coeruleoviolacea]MCP2165468.1 hypothetical protein [Goodfellowiella coeruleoviolacea]